MAWKTAMVLLCLGSLGAAQQSEHKPELFVNHLGVSTLPARATISAKTCGAIIKQADEILMSNKLGTLAKPDLQVASLNLRTCATSELTRFDRDLAVGLYGEVVFEIERRERAVR